VLDHSGKSLTQNQNDIISEWVTSFPSCKPWTCPPLAREDEEILTRLIGDRRIDSFFGIAEVSSRNSDFATHHPDLLLDEMVARGANSGFSDVMGAVIARLDAGKLRARRDLILPRIRSSYWTRGAREPRGIGILAGRLGIDTSDLIAERLKRRESAETAAVAACMADIEVGQKLVPALKDYLHTTTDRGFPDRYTIKALIRFGHYEEVKDVTRAVLPKLAERYSQARSETDITSDIGLCDPE
jgi:hypothetical protein